VELKRGKTPVNQFFQDVLPAPLLPFFTPATFYFFLKVKSELASYLLAQGNFKKSM
jgi:hypothetical protein